MDLCGGLGVYDAVCQEVQREEYWQIVAEMRTGLNSAPYPVCVTSIRTRRTFQDLLRSSWTPSFHIPAFESHDFCVPHSTN